MRSSRRIFAVVGLLIGFGVPLIASATILPECAITNNPKLAGNCGLDDFVELFSNAYGWGLSILGALALFFFVYGGFVWLIAAGNQERIERGKKILGNTLIGVIIGLTSWMIVNVVIAFLVTPPGQTVDFTGTKVLGRPWWNFWGNLPQGCCVGANGCSEDVTKEKCEQELNGEWAKGVQCDLLDKCLQGCCVPDNLAVNACMDSTSGSCPAGYRYVGGQQCASVTDCRGCCVKTTASGNICTLEQKSADCVTFSPGPCAADDPRCPSDPAGCCVVGGTCTDDVRRHDCSGLGAGHFPFQSCKTVGGCP